MVVSCEVVKPYPDRPTEGFFKFNASFSPMASPAFGGRVSSQGVEIGRIVERGLRESGAIDTEALCIIAGEKVWSVRLDMHIIDDHGNLTDCCSIGAITALHHFRRPDVTISGGAVEIHSTEEREPVPLSIHHMPISVSFAIFGEGTLVVDPSWKEEKVCNGRMTITLNAQHELCAMQKAGGVALTVQQLVQATQVAQVKVVELSAAVEAALRADKDTRKKKIHVAASELMTNGIGLEEIVQNEINDMDIDGKDGENRFGKRGLRFFQGPESLDMPDLDEDEYDDEYVEVDEESESDAMDTDKPAPKAKPSSSAAPSAAASTAAAPKKGPIVKAKKESMKPADALKALTQKAKVASAPAASKPKVAASAKSSSSMDVDKPSESDERRTKVNKQAFEQFASQLLDRTASDKKSSKKVTKRSRHTQHSDEDD